MHYIHISIQRKTRITYSNKNIKKTGHISKLYYAHSKNYFWYMKS